MVQSCPAPGSRFGRPHVHGEIGLRRSNEVAASTPSSAERSIPSAGTTCSIQVQTPPPAFTRRAFRGPADHRRLEGFRQEHSIPRRPFRPTPHPRRNEDSGSSPRCLLGGLGPHEPIYHARFNHYRMTAASGHLLPARVGVPSSVDCEMESRRVAVRCPRGPR